MARAFGVALGAFGIALAGLILPAAFAALSSVSPGTAIAAATAAIAAAGLLALRRLASELAAGRPGAGRSLAGGAVFLIWAASALAIAGRLWWVLAVEVGS
jgi:hypothetical protein